MVILDVSIIPNATKAVTMSVQRSGLNLWETKVMPRVLRAPVSSPVIPVCAKDAKGTQCYNGHLKYKENVKLKKNEMLPLKNCRPKMNNASVGI